MFDGPSHQQSRLVKLIKVQMGVIEVGSGYCGCESWWVVRMLYNVFLLSDYVVKTLACLRAALCSM